MADEIRRIITVDVSGAVDSLEEMEEATESAGYSFKSLGDAKKYIDKLRASLIDLDEDSEEYVNTVAEIDVVQDKLNKAIKATGSTIKNAEGSYNALSKQMSELKKRFKETNDEAERAVLAKQIVTINDQLKTMDASIGNYQRNVGNYEAAFTSGLKDITAKIEALGNPLAIAKNGVIALGKAMKTLIANPVGAVIMAIVAALSALKKGFQGSEEASNSLKRAFAAFQPVINAINNLFTSFAKIVGNIAEKVIPALVNGVQTAEKKILEFLNRLGIVSDEKLKQFNDSIQAQKEAVEVSKKLTEEEISLTERKRKFLVDEAKAEKDIAELREKASQKDKYSAAERQRFLEDAITIEKNIYGQKLRIAKDEYQLAKDRAKLTDNNAEDNQKLAEAEANLYRVQAEVASKLRGLNKEKLEANKGILSSENDTVKKIEEIQDRIFLSKQTETNKELILLRRKYEEEKALVEGNDKLLEDLDREYYENKTKIIEKENNKILELDKKYRDYFKSGDDIGLEQIKTQYNEEYKIISDFYNERLSRVKEGTEEEKAIISEFNQAKLDMDAYYNGKKNELVIADYENSLEYLTILNNYEKQAAEETLSTEYEKKQKWFELEDERLQKTKDTYEKILELDDLTVEAKDNYAQKLAEINLEIDKNDQEMIANKKEHVYDLVNTYSQAVDGIGNLMGSIADIMEANIKERQKNGEISEEQAEKEFENVKKVQIAQAIINGLAGVATAVSTAMQLGPIAGPIMAAINSAVVIASTVAQIAKIKSTSIGGGSSSSVSSSASSSAATPSSAATAYVPNYSTNVTGESENVDLANAISEKQGDTRVYVVESDIAQAGKKAEVRESESTF